MSLKNSFICSIVVYLIETVSSKQNLTGCLLHVNCQLIIRSDIQHFSDYLNNSSFIYSFYLRYIHLKYTVDTACSLQSNQELK